MSLTISQLITKDYGTGPDPGYFHNDVTVTKSRTGMRFDIEILDRTKLVADADKPDYFSLFIDGTSYEFSPQTTPVVTLGEFDPSLGSNDDVADSLKDALNGRDDFGQSGDGTAVITTATRVGAVVTFYSVMPTVNNVDRQWSDTAKFGQAPWYESRTIDVLAMKFTVTPPDFSDISDATTGDHFAVIFPSSLVYNNTRAEGGTGTTSVVFDSGPAEKMLHWLCERLRQAQITDGNTGSNLLSHKVSHNSATGKLKMRYTLTFETGLDHLSDQATAKSDANDTWVSVPGSDYDTYPGVEDPSAPPP